MSNHVPFGFLNSFSANSRVIFENQETEFPKKGISADRISYNNQVS